MRLQILILLIVTVSFAEVTGTFKMTYQSTPITYDILRESNVHDANVDYIPVMKDNVMANLFKNKIEWVVVNSDTIRYEGNKSIVLQSQSTTTVSAVPTDQTKETLNDPQRPPFDSTKQGVILSFGGGMTIKGATGSFIEAEQTTIGGNSTLGMGGNFSIRIGYRFNRVVSLHTGIDFTSKGYRLLLDEYGTDGLYYENGGTAVEIPILFRPILNISSTRRSFLIGAGIAPSFLLTHTVETYIDSKV